MSENGGCRICDCKKYYLLKCYAGKGEGKKAKVHPITGCHRCIAVLFL